MITRKKSLSAFLPLLAGFGMAFLFLAVPAHGQTVEVDLSATSGLCGGQECFNADGLFTAGTTFLGTDFLDGAGSSVPTNCTPPAPFTTCPDAYSASPTPGLGLTAATATAPAMLTPPSLSVPFVFGPVNTAPCGPGAPTPTNCLLDTIELTSSGVDITAPTVSTNPNSIYSTMIMLGTGVNGSHQGQVRVDYTSGSPQVFPQTFSDWCGPSAQANQSVAVGGINRLNATGTYNGASCNLYAYTYSLDFTRSVASITLTDPSGSNSIFVYAITLLPPTYTIDAGVAAPASVKAGSTTTATLTVTPQPGYVGTVNVSCSIAPTIANSTATKAPSCSLNPTSVTITAGETAPPTTTLTFTSAAQSTTASRQLSRIFYAVWLPLPGLALLGFGLKSRESRHKKLFGLLLLGLLLIGVMVTPACVSYTHLGNVGTPPGQYTVTVTGVDVNNLTQASNAAGTTNTVVVTVTDN